jgi:hypothetical protein
MFLEITLLKINTHMITDDYALFILRFIPFYQHLPACPAPDGALDWAFEGNLPEIDKEAGIFNFNL